MCHEQAMTRRVAVRRCVWARSGSRAFGAGLAVVCALMLGLLPACGPSRYLSEVSGDAQRALLEARRAGAQDLAPYEYWSAVEYLDMAKERAAYADFEQSLKYGDKAKRMARRAKRAAYEVRAAQEANKGPARDHRVRAEIPSRISQ